MSRLIIFGATGSLGSHVLRLALAAGHQVTVFVRTPSRLPLEARAQVSVHQGDLSTLAPVDIAQFINGHDALINCAGLVTDGQTFVDIIDRLVTAVESLPTAAQPVCWFLAGAALLDIDESGRKGVELPRVKSTYWPHRVNFERISRSGLDWRLLCPGPMVEEPALGLNRLRIALDTIAGSGSGVCPRTPWPVVSTDLCVLDPPDDRAVRRCGRSHACQPRSWRRHGTPPRRARAAARHARQEVAVGGQTTKCGLTKA